jgi:hypothetical protein
MKALIVCGSREWTDEAMIRDALDAECEANYGKLVVIEGCCSRGADKIAEEWAAETAMNVPGVYPVHFPARWKLYGRGAGPIRNGQMKDHLLTLRDRDGAEVEVLAFHDALAGSGTADMVYQATAAGIPCRVLGHATV